MEITDYILLFVSVFVAGASFFLIKKPGVYFLKLLLSFSGAFLFAITVLHLMPEVYSSSQVNIGLWILIGFFLQIVMEFFSEGIEHGHMHVHQHHSGAFPLTMMISLCLHSFLEAMPLFSHAHAHDEIATIKDNSLFIGIVLHHIPVAFALVSMLMASGLTKQKTLIYLGVFALMTPLGSFFSFLLSENTALNFAGMFDKIMAIVIGIFLHISTTILFESGNDHRFNFYKIVSIIVGGFFGILLTSI